jgi:hypothetical protein
VLSIELMDLVVTDREATLDRLCGFVDVPVDAGMVAWFDANVTADGMHPGRWRRDFDDSAAALIDETYSAICGRLASAGVAIPA